MGKSEGHRAIEKLDGHMFTRHGRPLVVQLGHNQVSLSFYNGNGACIMNAPVF